MIQPVPTDLTGSLVRTLQAQVGIMFPTTPPQFVTLQLQQERGRQFLIMTQWEPTLAGFQQKLSQTTPALARLTRPDLIKWGTKLTNTKLATALADMIEGD